MPGHAARLCGPHTAVDQAQVTYDGGINLKSCGIKHDWTRPSCFVEKFTVNWINPKARWVKSRRHPIPCIAVFFSICSEQTDAQAQVQSEVTPDFPVILEIGFGNFEALIVASLCRVLREALDESLKIVRRVESRLNQKIRERISSTVREVAECQQSLRVSRGRANGVVILIALRVHKLSTELESVFADGFTDVVPD